MIADIPRVRGPRGKEHHISGNEVKRWAVSFFVLGNEYLACSYVGDFIFCINLLEASGRTLPSHNPSRAIFAGCYIPSDR